MTKPFYKRTSFVALLVGVLLTFVGFILSANAIFATIPNAVTSVWSGVFLGMGMGDMVCGAVIRQLEKKLDAKNVEQKASQ
jgi:divalent metal cation (Fe/Co/Zn/Cd) transporter